MWSEEMVDLVTSATTPCTRPAHRNYCGLTLVGREDGKGKVLRGAVHEFRAQGPQIAAAGIAGVVAVAGRTGPGMEIAGRGKILADQAGSDRVLVVAGQLAVLVDQRTVGLDGKDGLADGPDGQRIEPAADAPRTRVTPIEAQTWPRIEPPRSSVASVALFVVGFRVAHCCVPLFAACYARCRKWTIWSISQIPGKGQMTPPTP